MEAALGVISVVAVVAGGIGPCGLTGHAPGFVRVIHQPGFWLAGVLVADSSVPYLPLALVFTTIFLSVLAWIPLRFGDGRNIIHRPDATASQIPTDRNGSTPEP